MRPHFFSVPVVDPGSAAAELNAFRASHRVVAVQRELIHDGPCRTWSVCVTVAGGAPQLATIPSQGAARVENFGAVGVPQRNCVPKFKLPRHTCGQAWRWRASPTSSSCGAVRSALSRSSARVAKPSYSRGRNQRADERSIHLEA